MTNSGYLHKIPNQITVNKYDPGQGIPPHIDNPEAFDETLASLSLGSQTVMDFKSVKSCAHVQVILNPCTLVVFTGDARYKWTHGICPRKVDIVPVEGDHSNVTTVNRETRYSITFRRVREDYKGPYASQIAVDPVASKPKSEEEAASLEELHVHKVYDEIAAHFTATRDKPWPKVKKFIDGLQARSIVLDVGCGSGRYLGVRDDVEMIGCDRSENLMGICKEKGFEVFICDGLNLPLGQPIFDACICIAVIHHYSTLERRLKAIQELLRVTKPGGRILISVWALEQEYKKIKSKYLKIIGEPPEKKPSSCQNPKSSNSVGESHEHVETTLRTNALENSCDLENHNTARMQSSESIYDEKSSLPVHKNRTPFQQQDVLVPWHKKNISCSKEVSLTGAKSSDDSAPKSETFHRYYHVFKKGELEDLCQSFDNVEILESYYDEGNWCIILKKL